MKSTFSSFSFLNSQPIEQSKLADPLSRSGKFFRSSSSQPTGASAVKPEPLHFSNKKLTAASKSTSQKSTIKRVEASTRLGKPLRGVLSKTDRYSKALNSYIDDYALKGVKAGQLIEVNLRSNVFDGYLQLLDARTRKVLLYGEDTSTFIENSNARLVFTAKPGVSYLVRISRSPKSTYDSDFVSSNKTGSYTLSSRVLSAPASDFDFFYGAGLVDADAAVARAIGQNPFANVPLRGGDDWDLDQIKVPAVWAKGYTGQGVTVAILDSGVDYSHPDLKDNIWTNTKEIPDNGIDDDGNGYVDDVRGWNFVSNSNNTADTVLDGHGTHVAGIVAAANNGFGVTGVAPNAKIMPIKVIDGATTSDATIAKGIRYAANNGAKVINLSLGSAPDSGVDSDLESALQYAHQAGVVVVIAAGNEREQYGALKPDDPGFYAAVRNLGIVVGDVDINRKVDKDSNPAGSTRASFVVAPGVNILSTYPSGQYEYLDGTSMSTPQIAGVVTLMLSANPNLTPDQIATILTATADRQGITTSP